jgi:hypothetical protein
MFEAHTRATNVSKACSLGVHLGDPKKNSWPRICNWPIQQQQVLIGHTKERQGENFFKSGVKRVHHNKHAELKISSPEGRSLGLPRKT